MKSILSAWAECGDRAAQEGEKRQGKSDEKKKRERMRKDEGESAGLKRGTGDRL